jgi:zinc and cadmium transporter
MEAARVMITAGTVFVLSLVGGLLPLVRTWDRPTLRLLLAFGAGVLLAAAFFHMIPEAIHVLGESVGAWVLAGFLLIYVLERFMMVHPCGEENCEFHHIGIPAFCGMTVHALIDGLALGAGFAIPELTVAITAAILLHKLPSALSLTGILLHCNYSRSKIALLMVLFSAAAPLGALLSFTVLSQLSGDLLLKGVAVSAGTFIAIATSDILPQIHSSPEGRFRNLAALFAGILVMTLTSHGH